jgi:hypothetical protein
MSTQVDRLQALLERVQANRGRPRASAPAVQPAAAVRFDAPAPAPSASPPRHAPPAAPPAARAEPRSADRARAGATPLEMAFEDQLSGAHAAPQAKPAQPAAREPAPSFSPREAASSREPAAPAVASREGAMLVDPPVPQPSKPIVQVVSKHPPSVASNFGELLKRSLSLRPR